MLYMLYDDKTPIGIFASVELAKIALSERNWTYDADGDSWFSKPYSIWPTELNKLF